MLDDAPGLEVGFQIDTGGSIASLEQLEGAMDATEARIKRDATLIENATGNMVKLGGAVAQFDAFGLAADRATQTVRREAAQIERAGEAMVRQLERQNAAFGKSRDELRSLRAEERALAADRVGNTDLARRIREEEAALSAKQAAAASKAAQDEVARQSALAERAQQVRDAAQAYQLFERRVREGVAAMKAEAEVAREAALAQQQQQLRDAAQAYRMFERRVREGAAAMRDAEAAAERDAAALARLRAMMDPAAAAHERLNAELVEARRLLTAVGASAEEVARAEMMLADRMAVSTRHHDEMGNAARRNGFALQQVALQMPDIVQGLLTGQKPMQVFIQQGGQLAQVAQMAEGGVKGFAKELALLGLRFAPVIGAAAAAGAGMALFVRWVNQGVTNDQLTRDLGKITGGAGATKQELYKLREETVTWADVTSALFSEVGKDVAGQFVSDMKAMGKDVKDVLDDLTSYGKAALAGIYAGVSGTRAYLNEVEKGGVTGLGKMLIGQGDPDLLKKTYGAQYEAAIKYLDGLGGRVRVKAIENARDRIADKIGYNASRADVHAAALARDAEAVDAQIRNLYALADAYGVSGAAALIAEARVRAESKAIRQRGDIEAVVAREVRLSVAQRVSDAAKGTAQLGEQAAMQEKVNAAVAAGNVSAQLAGEMMRDQLADLPLLAALEAARTVKDVKGAEAAAKALDDQRAARVRLTDAERAAQMEAALAGGRDRLEELREETRLIGETDAAREKALAVLRATQQANNAGWTGPKAAEWIDQQGDIADATAQMARAQQEYNDALAWAADRWNMIAGNVQDAAAGLSQAFGETGRAIGDMAAIYADFRARDERAMKLRDDAIQRGGNAEREQARYALTMTGARVGAFGDMAAAARGYFGEQSKGYKIATGAMQAFRAIEFALSVKAMATDAVETGKKLATSAARTAAHAVEAVTKAIASLPFPANIAAGAATIAALAAIGVSVVGGLGGGGNNLPKANDGTGTVLGDPQAKSESIRRALDALKEVDTLMLGASREMAASLKSIESQIGGVASLVVRAGNVNANGTVPEGFKPNLIGSVLGKIPLIGGFLGSLFGSKTEVVGGGLFGGAQSLGSILSNGFDASYYSDVKKTSKFFGIKTGTSYSTNYSNADAGLEQQFTLILKGFSDAIRAAAGPLGVATSDIQQRLSGFIVNIGKIDLKGLTGAEIEEKLSAVFGAAADQMAASIFPGVAKFQRVGEGLFETVVRVSSTVETVSASLDKLGLSAKALGIDAKLGIASQFESLSAMGQAADAYFTAFYTPAEQNAAKLAQLGSVFVSLGKTMPTTLAGFRALVEAQDLTTAAGQSTYAALLQLAPAFADLKGAMEGAKSAADILAERQGLERSLLELAGNTAAIRALDLAKLDASNRTLQQQVWAVQDAQAAAKAAEDLRKAWSDVGGTIEAEIKRIRGLNGTTGDGSFAALQGQFNAQSILARAGDQDAAKLLPGLSQSLLKAAGDAATSRQELDRIQAQTAASLEATMAAIQRFGTAATASGSADRMAAAMTVAPGASTPATPANDTAAEVRALRDELAAMRQDNNAGHAATASKTGEIARRFDDVTAASGGEAISVASSR